MRCFAGIFLVFLGLATAEEDDSWPVHHHQGRPYLALANVQKNYGFSDVIVEDADFQLRGPGARVKGRTNQKWLEINGLSYHLHFAPIRLEGKDHHLAAYDVSSLLDLVLRPAAHLRAQGLGTVLVEAVEDQWSTRPDAKNLATQLQQALSSYGVTVQVLAPNSAGGGGAGAEEEPAWIRLQGNGKLAHHQYRCSVLAPPGAPKRADAAGAVFSGNLSDAESLALATLIQSGLILGPGARQSNAIDAGIRQSPLPAFQRARGAAVHVEWGEDTDEVHLLKSVAAGILRYSAFLDQQVELIRQQEASERRKLRLSGVELQIADANTLKLAVSLAKTGQLQGEPDRGKVELQAFVFAPDASGAIHRISAPPPEISWTSDDFQGAEALFRLDSGALRGLARENIGHVVRVIYNGEIQDAGAHPRGLLNHFWRYSDR